MCKCEAYWLTKFTRAKREMVIFLSFEAVHSDYNKGSKQASI